jgi:hypothetical protein
MRKNVAERTSLRIGLQGYPAAENIRRAAEAKMGTTADDTLEPGSYHRLRQDSTRKER